MRLSFIFVGLAIGKMASSQSLDTLILVDQKIIGNVKEVTPDQVAFTLPGNTVLYKINKDKVIRISYGSGRIEESALLKLPVTSSPEDWRNVALIEKQEEIQGVYKVGDVIVYGSLLSERTKNGLKMAAAMIGGNVVYPNNARHVISTRYYSTPVYSGGKYPAYVGHSYSNSYEQSIASVYTTHLPDTAAFRILVKSNPTLGLANRMKFAGRFNYKMSTINFQMQDVNISKFSVENGNIFIHEKIKGISSDRFHVNYFDKNRVLLSYRSRWGFNYFVLVLLIKH